MKGIVLAGGTGSRLWPATKVTSKQLLPVYDKPLIHYPISTLMLAGIRDILIITTPQDSALFKELLGNGSDLGVSFSYAIQPKPEGLAQALIIGETFLNNGSCLLILGDNIFHGVGLGSEIQKTLPLNGAHIFTYEVANPSEYGILAINDAGAPVSIEEKPSKPASNLAVTGLYYFDNKASAIAKQIKPSARGELEITSLINEYLIKESLTLTNLSRGTAWLDTGNPDSMLAASQYVQIVEQRTGLKIACLEEIALNNKWISQTKIKEKILYLKNANYISYLQKLLTE
jgi:glucose-1-phosphate thymidylyltransferase